MPTPFFEIAASKVENTAKSLHALAESLTKVAFKMAAAKRGKEPMPAIWLQWAPKQSRDIAAIVALGPHALMEVESQALCWINGEPNPRAENKDRSRRDYKVRLARDADLPKPPAKKRGRPRRTAE